MTEIAGLVLGGIPIAIWALEKYAEPLVVSNNSIETFRANLIMQKRHLQTTLSNIGLGSEPSIEELHECFKTKYSGIFPQLMFIVQRMDDVTAELMKNLDINNNIKPHALPEKFQWEWRRVKYSLSAKRRDKVVEDLRHWNEDLRRLLENSEVPAEDDSRKVQDLKCRFDVQRCNSIRKCLSSLHRALESGFRCVCSPPHQAAIDLDWTTHESDTAKPFKVAISYGTNSQLPKGPDSWRKLRITPETPETPTKMVHSVPELLAPSPTPARAPSSTSSIRTKVSQFKSVFSSSRPRPSPPTPPTTASLLKDPDED
ncbi:hypothetical protein BFW01_g1752 [Lasiodiplodia theobromae]|nr:hypothetical protein BFW01_g1752 [Lasiodiplodia theobromae]